MGNKNSEIYETYANMILESFAIEIELAEISSNINWAEYRRRIRIIAAEMRDYKFDFNCDNQ